MCILNITKVELSGNQKESLLMSGIYDESSIFTAEGLSHIRLRPTAYFVSTDIDGLVHQALELITNSIDEIALMPELFGRLTILLCIDAENSTYQLVVKDNGRGLPVGKLLESYTKLHTSGKFSSGAYEHSGGLFGVGAKASAGSSKHFRAISHRPEASASIYVNEGKSTDKIELIENTTPSNSTGVTVIFEPDPIIFPTDISLFGTDGQAKLLNVIEKYCFFRKLDINFCIYPLGLPSTIWKCSIQEAEATIATYISAAKVVFKESLFDRQQWLRNYFGIHRPYTLQHTVSDTFNTQAPDDASREIRVKYEVHIFFVKSDTLGGRFGMVNNLAIDDAKSTHFLTVTDTIKLAMSTYIKELPIRKFFLEQYRLPLYLAVDIKYPGAQPSGTTKHAFVSRAFRDVYAPSLNKQLELQKGVSFISALYLELAEDIEYKYTYEMTGVTKVKNKYRLFEEFKDISKRFDDCSTTNRSTAELFLVEGNSAGGGGEGRDSKTQGIYKLRGKPFNGITSRDELPQSAIDISNHHIYREIMTIVGIDPKKFDRSSFYYNSIHCLTDADSHGGHIASILVSNLYAVCPDIIYSGMLHIVVPPLYSVEYQGKRNNSPRIYFRDEDALQKWMAENVYSTTFDIGVRFGGYDRKTYYLRDRSYVNFLRLVNLIGDTIDNISEELVLDSSVVEKLTHIVKYLEPGLIDVDKIKEILAADKVVYQSAGHILLLTFGGDDHIIPLQNVRERLIKMVLPLMNRIKWRTTQIYITTKHTTEFSDRPISIMGVYSIMKTLYDQFKIKRYKGLGSMKPEDKGRTCMNPKTRNSFQITSIGDVGRVFQLLGDDSTHRKKLIDVT